MNAIVLYKGTVDEVPKLAPHPAGDRLRKDIERQREEAAQRDIVDTDEYETEESYDQDESAWDGDDARADSLVSDKSKKRPVSGPAVDDPYATADPGSLLIPIVVAIGAFVPIVFCLCKV